MNVIVDLFRCFCLIAFAFSFKIRAKNKNGGEEKDYQIEDYESYSKEPEVRDDDNKENITNNFSYIKNYNYDRNIAFGFQIPVDEGKSLAIKEPHYISIFAGNLSPGAGGHNLPYGNEKGIALQINPGFSSLQAFQPPEANDKNSKELKKLLCLADCKMVDLMAFNIKNHDGNGTFSWPNIPIAGRPYTFATLADWCSKNCGTSMDWEIPTENKHSLRPPDDNLPKTMVNGEEPREVTGPANTMAPQLFFLTMGQQKLQPQVKQQIQMQPKLQDQQLTLDTPTTHSLPNMLYQIPKSHSNANHGSGAFNLNANGYSDIFKMPIFGRDHYRPEESDFDNAEFDINSFKNREKGVENDNSEMQYAGIDPKTLDLKNGMKYRSMKVAKYVDSSEDEYNEGFDEAYLNEENYNDYDDNEYDNTDGRILSGDGCTGNNGAILQILHHVSRILSNETFQRLIRSFKACDNGLINGEGNTNTKSEMFDGNSDMRWKKKVLDLIRFAPGGSHSNNHDTAKEKIP